MECIIDMMGEVRLGLWAEDVGNEPFKAKGFGGKQEEKLLQISQWVEIVNVGQKNSEVSSVPTTNKWPKKNPLDIISFIPCHLLVALGNLSS